MTRLVLATDRGLEPLAEGEDPAIVAVAGADIALHRLRLAATGRRARADELAMRLADLAAEDPAGLHVATGAPDADGRLWVALVDPERFSARLAGIAQAGLKPRAVVPAALLLPEPEPGAMATAAAGPLVLVRAETLAAAVEPELVPHLGAGAAHPAPRPLAELLRARPPEPSDLGLDLRQGRFAPPVRWWRERRWRIGLGLLLLLALLLALAPALVGGLRDARRAAAHDAESIAIAARATGRTPASAEEAVAALAAARRAAEGSGIAARLAHAVAILERHPEVRLAAVEAHGEGPLALALAGPADAVNAAAAALASGPFEAAQEGSRVRLGPRRPPEPSPATPAGARAAEARVLAARADAMILSALPRPAARGPAAGEAPAPLAARVSALLARAGLEARPEPEADGLRLAVPAVRSAVLLPLLADLEAVGANVARLSIARNDDRTLRATLVLRETPP